MSIKQDVTQAKNHALSQLATMRDEARVRLHLLSLDARKHWDELERTFTALEHRANQDGERASDVLNENVNKLSRSFADFITSQMSGSSGLLTNVRSVMTTQVHTCSAEDSLARAAELMWESDCGIVPVVEGSHVVGLVTDRDICMATYTQGRPPAEIRVGSVMAQRVYACAADDAIGSALALMAQQRVRRLPVCGSDGRLVGMLALADIARWAQAAAAPGVEAVLAETLAAISTHSPAAAQAAAE
jgi:CBS domain-containing protein